RADVRFAFPDDLTTWRVTLVAVAANGAGRCAGAALAKESVRTARDVSVEPTLPRLVRAGDRLSVIARVSQDAAAGGPIAARLAANGEGSLRVGDGAGSPWDLE